jgi:hypothetical protein
MYPIKIVPAVKKLPPPEEKVNPKKNTIIIDSIEREVNLGKLKNYQQEKNLSPIFTTSRKIYNTQEEVSLNIYD